MPDSKLDAELEQLKAFHGHIGPYVVLGLRMGVLALEKLKARKYFGLKVTVMCKARPPESCLIDGLQFATGATYGKQNISLVPDPEITVTITNTDTNVSLTMKLAEGISERIERWMEGHDEETAAKKLSYLRDEELFSIR